MYNNNSNLRANRSAVDNLLKGLGAEPLFSNINDQPMGIPTPLNASNNLPLVNYNGNTAAQQDQKAFQEAFVTLLQKINEQNNTQNYNQEPQQSQYLNQNLNHNTNHNSNQNNSNQVGLPNPISILNEMHQRHKGSNAPPKYSFTIDPTSGQFYCQLEAFGKVFKTERSSVRKQQAKEDVALQALRSLVNGNNSPPDNNNNNNKRFNGSDIMKLYDPSFNYLDNRTDNICKSEMWYRKQLNEFPGKQPRVILLEFCQMHRLPSPIYQPNNDYVGNTYFECIIGDKYFKSDKAFPKSSEAKDYIANIAFEAIYKEICEAERDQFRRRNDMGQDSTRSSLLNFLENHTSSQISNNISNQSNLTSSHVSNPITSPVSRSISTNPNVTSSISPRLNEFTTSNNSLRLPLNSNVNSNSHLNELTTALVLPNFNHEIPNIKVEEANPLNPIIKSEEGNIGNVNYSTRDQQQSSSSSISFHPYRSPGRERFPSPGYNNNNNNNNNQFTKKNTGFCKKFTSLLYEMAQSKRWTPPEFNYENGVNGFVCVCNVQDYLFKGKAFSRKADAKESAAEEAYRFLTRNFRV